LWGTWNWNWGFPAELKKALEPKKWTSRMEAHDHQHQLDGVTNLLKQHSFGFRAVSCVVNQQTTSQVPKSINT
jgi:hypothetical protein